MKIHMVQIVKKFLKKYMQAWEKREKGKESPLNQID